jgi:hypothetical protein
MLTLTLLTLSRLFHFHFHFPERQRRMWQTENPIQSIPSIHSMFLISVHTIEHKDIKSTAQVCVHLYKSYIGTIDQGRSKTLPRRPLGLSPKSLS